MGVLGGCNLDVWDILRKSMHVLNPYHKWSSNSTGQIKTNSERAISHQGIAMSFYQHNFKKMTYQYNGRKWYLHYSARIAPGGQYRIKV